MYGTIQLHGGKLMIHINVYADEIDNENKIIPFYSTQFIPGDIIYIPDKTLYSRIEQPAVAIVVNIEIDYAILHIATLPSCPFSPTIKNNKVKKGDRLVVWLRSNGQIDIVEIYPDHPTSDAICLRRVYELCQPRPLLSSTVDEPLYTRHDCVDHTDLNTFTIDPPESVDFDDAISVDVEKKMIYVHIVDIAHATLSVEERQRLQNHCLTLYLANEVTDHLLDHVNASSTYSLLVGENRHVITVCMKLQDTMIESYEIYKSIINVKRRYTYEEVERLLMMHTPSPALSFLHELDKKRSSSILYQLYLPSLRFRINEIGTIDSVYLEEDNDAHRLVATAMIMTNMVVSKQLTHHGIVFPNRFHQTLHGMLPNQSMIRTHHKQVDSFLWVKKYARAYYALDEKGHFGLDIKEYVHFTSPMRRYADVIIHRILAGERFSKEVLEDEIDWINRRATLVKSIQSLYTKWKIGRYIQTYQPKQTIWITGVHKSGVSWYMPSYSLDGFAHVSTFEPKQYWKWKEEEKTLSDSNSIDIKVGQSYVATRIMVTPYTYHVSITIHIS